MLKNNKLNFMDCLNQRQFTIFVKRCERNIFMLGVSSYVFGFSCNCSTRYHSNLSYTSEVIDLGLFQDFNKASIQDRCELGNKSPNSFVNFFFFVFGLMVKSDILNRGFLKVMEENTCFPDVALFFFAKDVGVVDPNNTGKTDYKPIIVSPENLSHDDFVRINNSFEFHPLNYENTQ